MKLTVMLTPDRRVLVAAGADDIELPDAAAAQLLIQMLTAVLRYPAGADAPQELQNLQELPDDCLCHSAGIPG